MTDHCGARRRTLRLPLRLCLVVVTTLAVASIGTTPALASGHHHGHHASHHAADKSRTQFIFRARGYGSRIEGGQLPASSGTVSYQGIGCTQIAGTQRENHLADVSLPGLGSLQDLTETAGSSSQNGTVSSYSTHDIGKLVLAQSQLGSLEIKGISTSATTSHDASGYHADTDASVNSISLTNPLGLPINIPRLPAPGNPVTIPGLVTISVGGQHRSTTALGAAASATGLDILIIPTGTHILVAHTDAHLNRGFKKGLYQGQGDAIQADGITGLLTTGQQPLYKMPCLGTHGAVKGTSLADVTLPGALDVQGAQVSEQTVQKTRRSSGYVQSAVSSIDLGNGQLVINGVVGRANVSRGVNHHHLSRSTTGTSPGIAMYDGQAHDLNQLNGFTIPGLVQAQTNVVQNTKNGIEVTALQLTLLNGSGAVINLGQAKFGIS